jgi:hypothetical protein
MIRGICGSTAVVRVCLESANFTHISGLAVFLPGFSCGLWGIKPFIRKCLIRTARTVYELTGVFPWKNLKTRSTY